MHTPIRFGLFELHPETGEFYKDGTRLHLQEQPFKVLLLLLDRPGELVSREELKQAIAPDSTFGDFDHALNVAMAKLRTALNDSAENPRFIETLPKRGYRFLAPVNGDVRATSAETGPAAPPMRAVDVQPQPKTSRLGWWVAAGATVLLLVVATILLWLRPQPPRVYQPIAFTTLQGVVSEPAFSPDGNEIAFVWQRSNPSDRRIYVQVMGSLVARQLVDDADANHLEREPQWFPDGRSLAYIRERPNEPEEIWTVPRTGGTPRKLLGFGRLLNFDIAPDEKSVVLAEYATGSVSSLYLVTLENMSRRLLTRAAEVTPAAADGSPLSGDRLPRFSPDGRSIAFMRYHSTGVDLFRIPASGGEAERLTDDLAVGVDNVPGYTWDADGKSLIVIAGRPTTASTRGWWRLWLKGKRWEPLSISGGTSLAVSVHGRRLAFVQSSGFINIWRFELPRAGHNPGEPVNLTRSTSMNRGPKHSPDGSRIVFASNRTGHYEIYVANSDGSSLVQLTSFQGKDAGSPRWSPDGKQITFDYRPDDHAHIFVIDASGGPPRQMTFGEADDVIPRYSQDGRQIYFARLRKGGSDLWKLPSGGGTPVLVAADAFAAEESADGRALYYIRPSQNGMYVRRALGGEEQPLLQEMFRDPFVVVKDGIYYRRQVVGAPNHQLMFYDFATRRSKVMLQFPYVLLGATNISISPDRAYFLEAKREPQSNIMLVENFQ